MEACTKQTLSAAVINTQKCIPSFLIHSLRWQTDTWVFLGKLTLDTSQDKTEKENETEIRFNKH